MSDVLKLKAGGCGSGNCACKSQSREPFDETDYGAQI